MRPSVRINLIDLAQDTVKFLHRSEFVFVVGSYLFTFDCIIRSNLTSVSGRILAIHSE